MAKLSKKAYEAIDFALFCTGYYFVRNDDFEEGYCWQNAPEKCTPKYGPLLKYTSDQLYLEYKQQSKHRLRKTNK